MNRDEGSPIARALMADALRYLAETGDTDAARLDAEALPMDGAFARAAADLVTQAEAAVAAHRELLTGDREWHPANRGAEVPAATAPEGPATDPSRPPLEADAGAATPAQVSDPPSPEEGAERHDQAWPRIAFAVSANARVDEPFEASLAPRETIGDGGQQGLRIVDCRIPDGLGLHYQPEEDLIRGTPTRAGDFRLGVHYQFDAAHPEGPVFEGSATLTVNPDPRSLWQERPSDPEAPGWKPDTASALVRSASGRCLIAASKRGRSHAHVGGFRDDDFCIIAEDSGPWDLIAVADGAGSAVRARTGSQVAARVAAEVAAAGLGGERGEAIARHAGEEGRPAPLDMPRCRGLAYEVLGRAALAAVKAIEETAEREDRATKDYATTLLLAAHRPLSEGHLLISFWVGDGAIATLGPSGAQLLGAPDGGAFAGQTRFLDRSVVGDANEIMARIRVAWFAELTALLVMTDGVSDAYFESDQALGETAPWQTLWEQVRPLLAAPEPTAELLAWLDFWSPGNHDDRTIAVLW